MRCSAIMRDNRKNQPAGLAVFAPVSWHKQRLLKALDLPQHVSHRVRWAAKQTNTIQRKRIVEALITSTTLVTLAEMGDKTQLLSLVLAARYRKPWPIIWGIFVATVLNHALAGALGAWITVWVGPDVLRWVLGISFLLMAVWMLIPDKLDDDLNLSAPRAGIFWTTVGLFFLAEMGDKTQIATVMLAAQYSAWWAVVLGTTLGMMLANAPVVWFGEAITKRVPMAWVHKVSAAIFVVLGLLALFKPLL